MPCCLRLSVWLKEVKGCRETFLGSPSKAGGVLPLVIEEPPQVEVQPLHTRAPKEILLGQEQPDLPQASLTEHFESEPFIAHNHFRLPAGSPLLSCRRQ